MCWQQAVIRLDDGSEVINFCANNYLGLSNSPKLVEAAVSGPTGGLLGGKAIADMAGLTNAICCDLGGTSFDICLIVDGEPHTSSEGEFEGYPVKLPIGLKIRHYGKVKGGRHLFCPLE